MARQHDAIRRHEYLKAVAPDGTRIDHQEQVDAGAACRDAGAVADHVHVRTRLWTQALRGDAGERAAVRGGLVEVAREVPEALDLQRVVDLDGDRALAPRAARELRSHARRRGVAPRKRAPDRQSARRSSARDVLPFGFGREPAAIPDAE